MANRPSVANFAVALAAGLAMFTYAGALPLPAAAAETHYLAVWATLVLVAVAGLAVPPAYDLAAAAVLTTLVVWVVPHGPIRGAAVGLLLTLALVATALRSLERSQGKLTWSWTVAAALGLQFLCRADRFLSLEPEPRILVGVVALPVAAAAALMALERSESALPALLAAATTALLVPGWSVAVTLALVSIALGALWREGRVSRSAFVACSVILLAAAYWWQPSLAWLLLLVLLAAGIRTSWRTAVVAVLATALLAVLLPAARDWGEVLRLLSLVPLLLPAALLPAEDRRVDALQGLLLAVLALRTVAGPEALAAPLALLVLALRTKGVAALLQALWSGVLLAGAALLAGYPWLRSEPLAEVLGLFGIPIDWSAAVVVVALVWALSLLCAALAERSLPFQCRPVPVGAVLLAVAVLIQLPPAAERPLGEQVRILSATEPLVTADLESPFRSRSLVVDTYLDNSAELAAGTPVARLAVVGAEGEHLGWLLRAGYETGEWAARRPDVASFPGFKAPPHWLAWVAPDGDVFAQRYRAHWRLEVPSEVVRVEMVRSEDLPPGTSVAVFHLELRR